MKNSYNNVYIQCLANSGSYWGKQIINVINKYDLNMRSKKKRKLKKLNNERRFYLIKNKLQKENIKIHDLSLPVYVKRWLFLKNMIPYLFVPFFTCVFYLPLHILKTNNNYQKVNITQNESNFIVTNEFVNDVMNLVPPPVDLIPPAAPRNVRVTAK